MGEAATTGGSFGEEGERDTGMAKDHHNARSEAIETLGMGYPASDPAELA